MLSIFSEKTRDLLARKLVLPETLLCNLYQLGFTSQAFFLGNFEEINKDIWVVTCDFNDIKITYLRKDI